MNQNKSSKKATASAHSTINPEWFNDKIALKTDWSALSTQYRGNFFPYRLQQTAHHRIEKKPTLLAYLFAGGFVLVGLSTLFFIWWLGLLFTLFGAFIFYTFLSPWVLDKRSGRFWQTHKPIENETACDIFELHALQFLHKQIRDNDDDLVDLYELNGIFWDAQRIHLLEDDQARRLWHNAQEVADFLNLPLWDGSGKMMQAAYAQESLGNESETKPTLIPVSTPKKRPFPWWELLFPNITLLLGLGLLHWDVSKIIWAFFLEILMIVVVSLFRPSASSERLVVKFGIFTWFLIFYAISVIVMYITLHTPISATLETRVFGEVVASKQVSPLIMVRPSSIWFIGTALLFLFGHIFILLSEYFRSGIRSISHHKQISTALFLSFCVAVLGTLMSAQFDSAIAILVVLIALRSLTTLINHWIQQYRHKRY